MPEGTLPRGLLPPVEVPPIADVLLEVFLEMNLQRPRNGLDVCPLDPAFFFFWQRNNRVRFTIFEQSVLVAFDHVFRKVMNDG